MPQTPTVQVDEPPRGPQIPCELERRLRRCRTGADHVDVLIEWGWEHGFILNLPEPPPRDDRGLACAPNSQAGRRSLGG